MRADADTNKLWLLARLSVILLAPMLRLLVGCADPDHGSVQNSCTDPLPSDEACPAATPSYTADVAPVVAARCAGCHYAGNRESRFVLETWTQISDSRQLVATRVYRCQMPPAEAMDLTSAERQTLLQWLVCGAPDN